MLSMFDVKILLIAVSKSYYVLGKETLTEIYGDDHRLNWVKSYDEGIIKLSSGMYDVCLLDNSLGEKTGIDLLRAVNANELITPVIILTEREEREIDIEATKAGAADYIIKSELNASLLERSIRYSIQQKRIQNERINLMLEREARIAAENANKAKDEFLAMVSHELRAPLNTMLGWVKLLQSKKLDTETFDRGLDAIERSAKAQAKLIEDLLDISRIIRGKFKLSIASVNIHSLLDSAIEATLPTATAKNISLILNIDKELEIIEADPDRLLQVITNLLSNAIKFTPQDGKVTVSLKQIGDYAEISVSDTGIGITKEMLPRIFERYHQASASSTKRHSGLGLGLSIVRTITEAHGGSVSVESEGEGRGATFKILLPINHQTLE